jgi:hypothetical protein
LTKLNFRVENQQGKESVLHINRKKRAFKQRNLERQGEEKMLQETAVKTARDRRGRASNTCTQTCVDPNTAER